MNYLQPRDYSVTLKARDLTRERDPPPPPEEEREEEVEEREEDEEERRVGVETTRKPSRCRGN